jgi:hypothetical protein
VLRITTPTTSMETMVSDQRLSDRNRRDEVTFAAARVVSERLPSVRLIGWGQRLQYKSQTTTYFSPSSFMRLDGGIEYTYVLRRARFAGDRQDGISASFVEGTDNHAVSYHHPALRAEVSLSRHLLLEARGEWVRASTYRQSSLSVNLRVRNLAGD